MSTSDRYTPYPQEERVAFAPLAKQIYTHLLRALVADWGAATQYDQVEYLVTPRHQILLLALVRTPAGGMVVTQARYDQHGRQLEVSVLARGSYESTRIAYHAFQQIRRDEGCTRPTPWLTKELPPA